jgi:hypothetical protein
MAGADGKSMLYLESRCVALARAIGAQGVQNGGIDGASVAAAVPSGPRELMAENVMVMARSLESCGARPAAPVAGWRAWAWAWSWAWSWSWLWAPGRRGAVLFAVRRGRHQADP